MRKKYPKLPPEARILGDSGGWQQRNKQWWIPSWKSGKGQEPGRADRWRSFPAGIASLHGFCAQARHGSWEQDAPALAFHPLRLAYMTSSVSERSCHLAGGLWIM